MSDQLDFDDSPSSSGDSEDYEVYKAPPGLVSDGKRMRSVWRPGDGDGDPSPAAVERTMYAIGGHPTWKIFIHDIPLPIVRGSENEPPHHVYLDDRACYAIYCSNVYSNAELRDFYPFDFNHQGHIKQGRLNRGNPAYLDDSYRTFATGKLRGKGKFYTFSGAPQETEYKPRRTTKRALTMEQRVAQEFAERQLESDNMLESQADDETEAEIFGIPPFMRAEKPSRATSATASALRGGPKSVANQASLSSRSESGTPNGVIRRPTVNTDSPVRPSSLELHGSEGALARDGSNGIVGGEQRSRTKRPLAAPEENDLPTKRRQMSHT